MMKFEQTTIKTTRIKLRWLRQEDKGQIFKIFSDKVSMRYWSLPPMQNLKEAEELLTATEADYQRGNALRFGLECRTTTQLLGTCSLFNFHFTSRRAEIGYILDREYWGQGLMNEALIGLIEYAFNVLGLHRLEADIDPSNDASRRSLVRLGFSREGLLRERWIVNGEVTDSELYGLLCSEWKI